MPQTPQTVARRTTAISLLLTMAAVGCGGKSERAEKPTRPPIAVTVATASMSDLESRFEVAGIVQAKASATLTARIVAPVQEVRVVAGDRVKAGQILLVLDARELEARSRSARASAAAAGQAAAAAGAEQQSASAALALARATHERIAELEAKRSATRQELDEATASLLAAEARSAGAAARIQEARSAIESANAAGDSAITTESFALITAPFDGIVTEKLVDPGNMAAPGTPLLRMDDTSGFRVDIRADETRMAAVRPGLRVSLILEGVDGADQTVVGTVGEVGRAVDADSRTFLVKIALPGTPSLRSGAFARARFPGSTRRALTVPAAALVPHGQVTSVFVVEHQVARVRLVSMNDVEVLAGVVEGETVVVNPPSDLLDGSAVVMQRGRVTR